MKRTLAAFALFAGEPIMKKGPFKAVGWWFVGVLVCSHSLCSPVLQAQTPGCALPPPGLVSWWRADGSGVDELGGNNGVPTGDAAFTQGRVGQAFLFDGLTDGVRVGTATNLQLQDFTIEAWVERASASVVSYGEFGNGFIFAFGAGGYGLYLDPDGKPTLTKVTLSSQTASAGITDTNFHHLAVTKSGPAVVFYIDGLGYPAADYDPGFVFTTTATVGAWGDSLEGTFLGAIDELAVYSRALTASEVQAIYNAGSSGKCSSEPPVIVVVPSDQTVIEHDTAIFGVVARGATPLSYQWTLNGAALVGATDVVLTLTNVQQTQAGTYAVCVTNKFGSTNSVGALLTVSPTPPCVAPVSGIVSWWRAEGSAADELGVNNGVVAGDVTFTHGRAGQAFAFDGVAGGVQVGTGTSLQLQDFTIETWIRRTSTSVVSYGAYGNGFVFAYGWDGYGLYLTPDGRPNLTAVGGGSIGASSESHGHELSPPCCDQVGNHGRFLSRRRGLFCA